MLFLELGRAASYFRRAKIVKGESRSKGKPAFFLIWPSRLLSSQSKDSERREPKQGKARFLLDLAERLPFWAGQGQGYGDVG